MLTISQFKNKQNRKMQGSYPHFLKTIFSLCNQEIPQKQVRRLFCLYMWRFPPIPSTQLFLIPMLGTVFALISLFCALAIKNSCFSAENGSCILFAKLTAIRADSSEAGHLTSLTRAFFILPLAHFTFDKWQDVYNTVTNAPIYSPNLNNLNKCRLQWFLLLIYARKHHAIPLPFVWLLIRPEQCSIVGLFP